MITKDQILEESKHFLGSNNKLMKDKYIKRKELIHFLVEKGIYSDFEERSCLKRELKKRNIKFGQDVSKAELVQLAIKKKIDFNEFIL
jgi:hypothetical protein